MTEVKLKQGTLNKGNIYVKLLASLRGYLQQAAVNEGRQDKCQVVVHQVRPNERRGEIFPVWSHLVFTPIHDDFWDLHLERAR